LKIFLWVKFAHWSSAFQSTFLEVNQFHSPMVDPRSGVGDDGDALLDDGGLALALGQPELGAEEDVLPVGVEVHRQRDHGLRKQDLNQSATH